jgi:hypothetical protein
MRGKLIHASEPVDVELVVKSAPLSRAQGPGRPVAPAQSTMAMHSISTRAPSASPSAPRALRAGRFSGK